MELLDLPNEMLQKIAGYLPVTSLARLGETCKSLYSIANIDSLWQYFCFHDFNISKADGWKLTFKEIYTKILLRVPVLGLRRTALAPFGGLVHICWCEGQIKVNRLNAGRFSKMALTSEPLYSIQWNHDKQDIHVTCLQAVSKTAPARVARNGDYTLFECSSKNCFKTHQNPTSQLGRSLEHFPRGFEDHCDAFTDMNVDFYTGFNCPLLPLRSNSETVRCPVMPGIYKGDYGAHGVEILQVGINEEQTNLLEGLKLTGDPNVPAGNVSITVRLEYPVILTQEDQESVHQILELDKHRTKDSFERLRQSNDGDPDLRQPFRVPNDCSERGMDIPRTCFARYIGYGRIAGHFFTTPSLSALHFVKFDDDTFGIVWLELRCMSVFHREKQDFPVSIL